MLLKKKLHNNIHTSLKAETKLFSGVTSFYVAAEYIILFHEFLTLDTEQISSNSNQYRLTS